MTMTRSKTHTYSQVQSWCTFLSHTNTHTHTDQHNHVHAALHQQVKAVAVIIVCPNGGTAQQLLAGVFGGQREVSVLLQVCASDDGHQTALCVHDGQLA